LDVSYIYRLMLLTVHERPPSTRQSTGDAPPLTKPPSRLRAGSASPLHALYIHRWIVPAYLSAPAAAAYVNRRGPSYIATCTGVNTAMKYSGYIAVERVSSAEYSLWCV